MNAVLQRLFSSWNQFWFSRESRDTLCLLRIFFGIVLIMKLTGSTGFLMDFKFEPDFPDHQFFSVNSYRLDGFRQPIPGFEWLPSPSFGSYLLIEKILLLLAVLFTAGFITRFTGPALALLFGYLFVLDQMSYHHHVFLFVIVLFILGFTNCSSRYSIDSLAGIHKPAPPEGVATPRRMLQVLVSVIYFFSSFSKMNEGWFSGDIIRLFYQSGSIHEPLRDYIAEYNLFQFMSVSTVLIEFFLAFALWILPLRRVAVLAGVFLHLIIDMTIDVSTFSFQMIALYTVFAFPECRTNTIYLDSKNIKQKCIARAFMMFDWLRRFRTKYTDKDRETAKPDGASGQLVTGNPDGSLNREIAAYIHITALLPLLFPLSWFLSLIRYVNGDEK